jgi:serine/threonine-protein kinase HipA
VTKSEDLRRVEKVRVMKQGEYAGILTRTERGAEFIYDEDFRQKCIRDASRGVACTLSPLTARYPITGVNLHPFFAGLLPEGIRLKALKSSLKTSEDDLFTMLLALGEESIGDVCVEDSKGNVDQERFSPVTLESADFTELLDQSIAPSLVRAAADIGVPGVMPKLSASMITFPVRVKNKKNEYILKLQPREYPKLIENEYIFMNMAKACGLPTADVAIVQDSKGQSGLLVTRFDRYYDKTTKSIKKIHQEDACQILGVYPHDKYRVTIKDICEGVAHFATAPIVEIKKIIELYLFSYIIGNGDLHGKNISLLENPSTGAFELSPCYDLLSTIPYGDRRMAVPMVGRDDKFRMSDFITIANQFEIPEKAIRTSIKRMIDKITPWMSRISEIGLDDKAHTFLVRTMSERIEGLQRG